MVFNETIYRKNDLNVENREYIFRTAVRAVIIDKNIRLVL